MVQYSSEGQSLCAAHSEQTVAQQALDSHSKFCAQSSPLGFLSMHALSPGSGSSEQNCVDSVQSPWLSHSTQKPPKQASLMHSVGVTQPNPLAFFGWQPPKTSHHLSSSHWVSVVHDWQMPAQNPDAQTSFVKHRVPSSSLGRHPPQMVLQYSVSAQSLFTSHSRQINNPPQWPVSQSSSTKHP